MVAKKETNLQAMIEKAIKNAKNHDIDLVHPSRNSANGNCIFESVINNINSRSCFSE